MKKAIFLFVVLFIINANLDAQNKWFQQKNSEFGDHVKVDGSMGSQMRESSGVFLDFNNDGLKDFIIPSYYDVIGSPDVHLLRFYKNMSNGRFKEITDSIINPDIVSGRFLLGFGFNASSTFDFNKDGKMDMIFTNGWENQNYNNYDSRFGLVKMRDYFFKDKPLNYIESRANLGYPTSAFFYQTNGGFKNGNKLFDTKIFAQDYSVQHSDMNNDGYEDLLIWQNGYKLNANDNIIDWLGGITLWINDAGKGFKFSHLKLTDSVNKFRFGSNDGDGSIGIGDFNGDGYKDILLFGTNMPYKARSDISPAQQDSVLWDANYITDDTARKKDKGVETRIYFSDRGVFSGSNYITIPGLRAMYSQGVDLNNDGKTDILAVWKNYRAGGYNGVYTDTVSNKDGVNNQYYTYINKGNNQFEDQTKSYFPSDNYRFSRLGRGDFYFEDIDGDGKKDFLPTNSGDDTLRDMYGTFAIDTAGSHATVYYKNFANQSFKKTIIDSFPRVLNWKNYPILKNIDSMYSQFYGQATPPLNKNEYLLDELYYLNNLYLDDLNNDGKKEIIGLKVFNNGINGFLNSKYNYQDSLSMHVGFSVINQCETPRLSSYIQAVCGSDTLSTRNIKIINFNSGDSIFWNYNNNIIKTTVDSLKVKELGWVVVLKKDNIGCITYNSDTLFIKNSPKPSAPRVYASNNTVSDANNICIGDKVNLASDPGNTQVTGTIIWYDNSKQLIPSGWGGVKTLYENTGNRNIATTSKIQVDTARNIYTRFLSDEGCYSDTSNFFKINFKIPLPSVKDTAYCNNISADTLKATSLTGHGLNWYGTSATGGTGSILGSKPITTTVGNFSYYVSQKNNSTGCEGARAKIGVIINPLPIAPVVRDTNYCNNASADTIRLNASTGATLLWYGTNATGGTGSSTAIKPSTATVGSANYYLSQIITATGCEGPRSKVVVTTKPIPSAPTLSRDTANFLLSGAPGTTWYKDGSAITDTAQKYKPTAAGSYTAKTTTNGCTSVMSAAYYYLVTDIINLSKDEFIKLAPNPFINQLNFDFIVKGYQKLNIEVYDVATGSKVATQQNITAGTKIQLGQLARGTYIVRVTSNDNKITQQFKMVKL